MRITREGGRVTLQDRPGLFWFLGLFLLFGGLLAIAAPLGLANNADELQPWERLASLVIGLSLSAAALWWLAQNPGSRVELDLTRRRLTVVNTGLLGRNVRQLYFTDLAAVEVLQGADSDGDPIWRPAVRLGSGEVVLLSQLWAHDQQGVLAGATAVAESCRLPLISPP